MELVKGVPITRYCDEHHLTPRERLELFVPVCQAVQHALRTASRDPSGNNSVVHSGRWTSILAPLSCATMLRCCGDFAPGPTGGSAQPPKPPRIWPVRSSSTKRRRCDGSMHS